MKKIIGILLLLLFPIVSFAQEQQEVLDEKTLKEFQKEKQQAEKKEAEKKLKELVDSMIENRSFVLEANYISGKSGSQIPVNSNLNFISVDSTEAVIQLGSPWGIGLNGVGGITVDGNITKYKFLKDSTKRGTSYSITMYIMSSMGIYDILLWVSQSGSATATIRGTTSGQLNYTGSLVPLSLSKVYKGQSSP
jgi:hypothetical protein